MKGQGRGGYCLPGGHSVSETELFQLFLKLFKNHHIKIGAHGLYLNRHDVGLELGDRSGAGQVSSIIYPGTWSTGLRGERLGVVLSR